MTTLIPKYTQVTTANRTIAEKFAEIISVKDYGAVGNGTTDDTAAIQAAVNATSYGGNLFFPEGKYKLTSAITLAKPITIIGTGPGTVWNSTGSYVIQTDATKNAFTLVAATANYAFGAYGITGINFQDICIQGPSDVSYALIGVGTDTTVNSGVYHIRENTFTNVIVKYFTNGINFTGIAYLNDFYNCQISFNTTGLLVAQGASGVPGGQTRVFGCTFDFNDTGLSWLMDTEAGDLSVFGCTFGDGKIGLKCNDETHLVVTGSHFETLGDSGAGVGIYVLTPATKANPVSSGCKYIVGNSFLSNDISIWFSNQSPAAGTGPGWAYPAYIDGNQSQDPLFIKLTTPTDDYAFSSTQFVLGRSNSGNNNGAIGSSQITSLSLGDGDNGARYLSGINGDTQALNAWLDWTPVVPEFIVTTQAQTQFRIIGTGGMLGTTGVVEIDGYTTS